MGAAGPLMPRGDAEAPAAHASTRWALLLALALLGLRLATLGSWPLTDTTEGRYGAVARSMAESGDWITPRVWIDARQVPYLGKPPLHFWLTSASLRALGPSEASARLPGAAAAAALLALLVSVVRRSFGSEVAARAALIALTSALFFFLTAAVALDMTLSLWTGGALLLHFAFLSEVEPARRRRLSLGVFACLGLGVVTKGPVALAVFGVPVLAWTLARRDWAALARIAWAPGLALFAALTVPWFALAELRNPGFLEYFLWNENLLRFLVDDYGDRYGRGHDQPYGASLVMLLVGGLPWTLVALALLVRRRGEGLFARTQQQGAFFLCGVAGITGLFLFAHQLLFTYLLPAIPLLSVWIALLMREAGIGLRATAWGAGATAAAYTAFVLIAAPAVDAHKSTRALLASSAADMERLGLTGRLRFYRKTPYSAYVYGDARLEPLPERLGYRELASELAHDPGHLYVFRAGYLARMPEALRSRFESVRRLGPWTTLRRRPEPPGTPVRLKRASSPPSTHP